jgi:hypothetical protein
VGRSWACVIAAIALGVQACGTPYAEKDPGPEGTDAPGQADGVPAPVSNSPKPSGTSEPTPAAPTPSTSPPTNPAPAGNVILHETFSGTSVFKVDKGALTIVPAAAGSSGRICADATGVGSITATIGPIQAGTYVISADVKADPAAPASQWKLDATTYTPTPSSKTDQGALASSMKTVTQTTVVGSAFSTTFSVLLGTAPNTCMIVSDIRVTFAP